MCPMFDVIISAIDKQNNVKPFFVVLFRFFGSIKIREVFNSNKAQKKLFSFMCYKMVEIVENFFCWLFEKIKNVVVVVVDDNLHDT